MDGEIPPKVVIEKLGYRHGVRTGHNMGIVLGCAVLWPCSVMAVSIAVSRRGERVSCWESGWLQEQGEQGKPSRFAG